MTETTTDNPLALVVEREGLATAKADKAAATERARLETKAREERKAREAVEAKERLRAEAESQRLAELAEMNRKAAAAPDREKLLASAKMFRDLEEYLPNLKTTEAESVKRELIDRLHGLAEWIEQEARKL